MEGGVGEIGGKGDMEIGLYQSSMRKHTTKNENSELTRISYFVSRISSLVPKRNESAQFVDGGFADAGDAVEIAEAAVGTVVDDGLCRTRTDFGKGF